MWREGCLANRYFGWRTSSNLPLAPPPRHLPAIAQGLDERGQHRPDLAARRVVEKEAGEGRRPLLQDADQPARLQEGRRLVLQHEGDAEPSAHSSISAGSLKISGPATRISNFCLARPNSQA